MASAADITLSFLLPSPYHLVYAIPLLVIAVIPTFSGAFLTLDRTSSFAPQVPVESAAKEIDGKLKIFTWWRLEGGIGGLASGWLFGVDLATFLSLLIINRTTSPPLTPPAFLAIHLPSSLLFALLCGRFKIAALACTGLAGGVSFALISAILLHPTLLTRLIFLAILAPLSVLATLLPVSHTQHRALRAAAAVSGAFAVTLSIALLAHLPSWANIWQRLWLHQETGPPADAWGTGVEHALSAAACILFVLGIVSDWALRRTFGENPDQKWDAYLAKYAANLPNAEERAGTFQPVLSLWQRIFHPGPSTPILFPPDIDLKPTSRSRSKLVSRRPFRTPATGTVPGDDSDAYLLPNVATSRKKRFEVKFQPVEGYSDSDSDAEGDVKRPDEHKENVTATGTPHVYSPPQWKPWPRRDVRASASPAVVEEAQENQKTEAGGAHGGKTHRDEPGWRPAFLSRYANADGKRGGESSASASASGSATAAAAATGSAGVKASDAASASGAGAGAEPPPPSATSSSSATAVSPAPPGPAGAVPMTPSLIRALDRIAVAQSEAYGYVAGTPPGLGPAPGPAQTRTRTPPGPSPPASPPPEPLLLPRRGVADKMGRFWERVQMKAQGR